MLKRSKIVNISLPSPNDRSSTANCLHQRRNEDSHKIRDDKQTLIHNCCQAIRIIVESKSHLENLLLKQGRMTQIFHETNKQETNRIILPLVIAQSVLHVLKQFLTFKIEQKQVERKSQSAKSKIASEQISNIKLLLNKLNQQNEVEQIKQSNTTVFHIIKNAKMMTQKFETKVKRLQTELLLFKEKLDEKNAIILSMTDKDICLKNKYNSQINKIIRNKKIFNINSNYLKSLEINQRQQRPLLQIVGKNELQNQNCIQLQDNESKNGNQGGHFDFISKDYTINNQNNGESTDKKYITYNLVNKTSLTNKNTEITANKTFSQSYSIPTLNKNQKNQSKASTFRGQPDNIMKLNEELNLLLKRKNKAVDQLNQNNHKIQEYLQKMQHQICEKKRQINNEANISLNKTVENKPTKEEFESLQIDGFYQNQ